MNEFLIESNTQFFILFPFIWAFFSMLAKSYFIMIFTMSKNCKVKIELFLF